MHSVVALVAIAVVTVLAAGTLLLALVGGRRRGPHVAAPAATSLSPSPSDAPAEQRPSVDLESVMADAGATLYIPIASGQQYLAVARPQTHVEGRTSAVPSQLAGAAVAGQAGLEAMVKAGQLSARLVVVDEKTAIAIKAGTIVTDKAGDMLGVIRGSSGRWSDMTRIKPLSGSLVRSASAGPAVMSAIAMQAQLAQVEKSISEVRDAVNAVRSHLDATERAAVEGRRETLATVYRTAQETGQMTQSLWDQIQDLEASLRSDVRIADQRLTEAVATLETKGASGMVGARLKWLHDASRPLGIAVASAADARRSVIQFAMLRLWWLAVVDDPTLASRQRQLRELLSALPDHSDEQARAERVLEEAGALGFHHRVVAPRKHKVLPSGIRQAQSDLHELPWQILNVRSDPQLGG